MIYLRDFYDENRNVNTKNQWVWYVHILSYSYIIYIYFLTDVATADGSESSKIWVPLDILLTFNIGIYQLYYIYQEKMERTSIVNPRVIDNPMRWDETNN